MERERIFYKILVEGKGQPNSVRHKSCLVLILEDAGINYWNQ